MHDYWRMSITHVQALCNYPCKRDECDAGVPGVKPVEIELTDFKTKEKVDTLEVDACLVATGRAPYTNVRHLESCLLCASTGGGCPVWASGIHAA